MDTDIATQDPPKRAPGRLAGLPKVPGSGRGKGVPNKTRIMTGDAIAALADPLRFLCDVARGLRVPAAPTPEAAKRGWCYPTLDQRLHAAQALAKKVAPDMKAVEVHGGLAGNQLIINLVSFTKNDRDQHP